MRRSQDRVKKETPESYEEDPAVFFAVEGLGSLCFMSPEEDEVLRRACAGISLDAESEDLSKQLQELSELLQAKFCPKILAEARKVAAKLARQNEQLQAEIDLAEQQDRNDMPAEQAKPEQDAERMKICIAWDLSKVYGPQARPLLKSIMDAFEIAAGSVGECVAVAFPEVFLKWTTTPVTLTLSGEEHRLKPAVQVAQAAMALTIEHIVEAETRAAQAAQAAQAVQPAQESFCLEDVQSPELDKVLPAIVEEALQIEARTQTDVAYRQASSHAAVPQDSLPKAVLEKAPEIPRPKGFVEVPITVIRRNHEVLTPAPVIQLGLQPVSLREFKCSPATPRTWDQRAVRAQVPSSLHCSTMLGPVVRTVRTVFPASPLPVRAPAATVWHVQTARPVIWRVVRA